jgi:CheY-like chemotaxis protein
MNAIAPTPKVLIAEDDATFRSLIGSMLMDAGYEVIEAADGGDLLERLADSAAARPAEPIPAMVITDLRMPGLSGFEALRFLRAGPWRSLPVILITAFGDAKTHARAHALGAVAVFDKPFDLAALRAKVEALMPPLGSLHSSSSSRSREPSA